jgi:toxin YoeB
MMISFQKRAWEDYLYWQASNKSVLAKVNKLIKDISRNPYEGIGKPEPLRYELAGYWSRRIDEEHRITYKITDTQIIIVQCRHHY